MLIFCFEHRRRRLTALLSNYLIGEESNILVFDNEIVQRAIFALFAKIKKVTDIHWNVHQEHIISLIQTHATQRFDERNIAARMGNDENARIATNNALAIMRMANTRVFN